MVKRGRKTTKTAIPQWAMRIADARERRGLSQAELGKAVGKSQQTIAGYEGGDPEPNLTVYRRIAKATDVAPAWLIFGNEGDGSAMSGIAIEANKQNRLFAWAFQQAARLFTDEGINADFSYMLRYANKLLRLTGDGSDDTQAKESVLRAIEIDRVEFRKDFDEARKKRL